MLDEYQQRAVDTDARCIRVLAAAGSGKSLTLIARIKKLVQTGVSPARIRAVTFSKKAAGELVQRLAAERVGGVEASTLHSLGLSIVRQTMPQWGVMDPARKRLAMRKALEVLGWPMPFNQAMKAVSQAKTRYCEFDFADVLQEYEKARRQAMGLDFDDMLIEALVALRAGAYQPQWQHILVDEVQDTDPLQWMMIHELTRHGASLFVVGDFSQSVYRFRGAVPEEMLDGLDYTYGTVVQVELPRNYRSVGPVVDLANETIEGRPGALRLQSVRTDPGIVEAIWTTGACATADAVLERVQRGDRPLHDFAVLYRTNAQSAAVENALIRARVPYVIVGDFSFYARAEIMDLLAYLRLAQGWDAEAAERVYSKPVRYLGAAFLRELQQQGGWDLVRRGGTPRFSRRSMTRGYEDFAADIETLQSKLRQRATPFTLLQYVAQDMGYVDWLKGEQPDDIDEVRAENVEMLLEAARDQATVEGMLATAEKCRQANKRQPTADAVQLLTVHRAKGLEWPVVCVVGCDTGRMPHVFGDPEEERRIAYVAFTRARDELRVYTTYGSPFIDHLQPRERDGEAVAQDATGDTGDESEPGPPDDDVRGDGERGLCRGVDDGLAHGRAPDESPAGVGADFCDEPRVPVGVACATRSRSA